jgi:hypothetical protein
MRSDVFFYIYPINQEVDIMSMNFEAAHEQFIQSHLDKRREERKSRLQRGHQHAEKLFLKSNWWHIRDMDRKKFSDELCREVFLSGLGWKILSFTYDDIKDRSDVVRMLLQMNLSPYLLAASPQDKPQLADNEILRLACHLARPIRPIEMIPDVLRYWS